jgi:Tol biopolymer transport system component
MEVAPSYFAVGEPPSLSKSSATHAPTMTPLTACRLALAALSVGSAGLGQVTERVDLGPNGAEGTGGGDLPLQGSYVSEDGRFVVFQSGSPNLVSGDTNWAWDIFVRDRVAGTTERVSVDSAGGQANGSSGTYGISMSSDGRFVAFQSDANNLVPGDTNSSSDIFLRDRLNGTTERITLDSGGGQANARSTWPSVSADGRFIAFNSDASNLVGGDTNGRADVFVRDRVTGLTVRASVGFGGAQSAGDSDQASISADGRYVAYESTSGNLVLGDTNGVVDAFLVDLQTFIAERVSVSTSGLQGNGISGLGSISGDGRCVAFVSTATNLVPGDTNGAQDIFLRDRLLGTTERVSVGTGGTQGTYCQACWINNDGRYVAFTTGSDFFPGDTAWRDIYVRDRLNDTTELVSLPSSGGLANFNSDMPSISSSGRFVVFRSYASNLVPGDTNALGDVFLHDRFAAGFTSLCEPGIDSVIACPCGNQPSASGRGCDNSSSTGGAILSASGIAYLAVDSLVFATSGERPTAMSILLQGDSLLPAGLVFGQGVRCAGGALKRLYLKSAAGGSITAPDLAAGDLSVSSRSALLGDPIQPGQSRYYLVFYRDPNVLGGCGAMSTFNATQTGRVSWLP